MTDTALTESKPAEPSTAVLGLTATLLLLTLRVRFGRRCYQ